MSKNSIIILYEDGEIPMFPVRPRDIDLSGGLSRCFSKNEVEGAAVELVSFFQRRNYWTSFSLQELTKFYKAKKFPASKMLFGLLGPWWDDVMLGGIRQPRYPYLVAFSDGRFCVTDCFVKQCRKHINSKAARALRKCRG